jgi:hypothetical protein
LGSGGTVTLIHNLGTRWGEWSGSRPGRFTPRERTPGTHCIGGWEGPRAGPGAVVTRNKARTCRESNPDYSVCSPVTILTDLPQFPITLWFIISISSSVRRRILVTEGILKGILAERIVWTRIQRESYGRRRVCLPITCCREMRHSPHLSRHVGALWYLFTAFNCAPSITASVFNVTSRHLWNLQLAACPLDPTLDATKINPLKCRTCDPIRNKHYNEHFGQFVKAGRRLKSPLTARRSLWLRDKNGLLLAPILTAIPSALFSSLYCMSIEPGCRGKRCRHPWMEYKAEVERRDIWGFHGGGDSSRGLLGCGAQ